MAILLIMPWDGLGPVIIGTDEIDAMPLRGACRSPEREETPLKVSGIDAIRKPASQSRLDERLV
jgi:hypothetical protein